MVLAEKRYAGDWERYEVTKTTSEGGQTGSQGGRKVRRVNKQRAVVVILSAILLFFSSAVAYLGLQAQIVSLTYQRKALIDRMEKLSLEKDRLNLQLAALSSPSRLETMATDRLGMTYPEEIAILVLETGDDDQEVPASPGRSASRNALASMWDSLLAGIAEAGGGRTGQ